ncbi:MAG: hypothetical protein FWB90_02035 [Fibromonadales bacterium]|nr:hypothetical protein [Fibromonadales bacterium]
MKKTLRLLAVAAIGFAMAACSEDNVNKLKDSLLDGCTRATSVAGVSQTNVSMCTTNQTKETCDELGGKLGQCKENPDKKCESIVNWIYYYLDDNIPDIDMPCPPGYDSK